MKIERTKNAGKNMALELLKNVYQVFMPFILRTAMIHCMGMEYTGLGGLFASVLDMLGLAELGVGSAMIFSMYKPIAEDDTETICALMRLYKIYYRIIGIVILVIGLAVTPFIEHFISGSCPKGINVYVLFLMNLAATVLSYWMFAYRSCLLQAYQKAYVGSKIELKMNVIFSLLQLLSLLTLANYYIYMIINIIRQIFTNISKAIATKKMYPLCDPKGKLDKKEERVIRRRIKDLFTSKLGSTITYSADTIIISSFLGLNILAQYQNYYYIFTSVLGLVGIVYNATRAGIGNSFVCETKEKNLKDLKNFTFIIFWISTFCISCFLGLYQPFMILWVGKENLLSFGIVICIGVMFILRYFKQLLMTYKDATGIWHQDRFRPLIAGMINLVMNIIMVQFWGLYGVVLSTIISELLIEVPWLLHNLFTTVFELSLKTYIFVALKYTVISVMVVVFSSGLTNLLPDIGIEYFILRILISISVPNLLLFIVYRRSEEIKISFSLAKRMLSRK